MGLFSILPRQWTLAAAVVSLLTFPAEAFATPGVRLTRVQGIQTKTTTLSVSRLKEDDINDGSGVNGVSKGNDFAGDSSNFAKLRKISNFASLLCVLDCTILPVITVLFPLLGFMQLGPSTMEFLHHLGHQIALFFVMPVGSLTSIVNFISHRRKRITLLAVLGLSCVFLANSHLHSLPFVGHVHWLHNVQHGPLHRIVNVFGCGMLLGSNYWSQQQPGCAHGPECGTHSHSHAHHDHEH